MADDPYIYKIKLSDGSVVSVAGDPNMSDDQIKAFVTERLKEARPEQRFAPAKVQRDKPKSFVQGVAEGAMVPWNNAARLLETGAEAIGLGGGKTVAQAEQEQQQMIAASPYEGTEAGRFTGNIVGTLPTMAIPGGPLVQGAAGGALLTDARDPLGVATDAAFGAVTAKGGDMVIGAGKRLLQPELSDSLNTLVREGIRTTPGQTARAEGRGFLASREDAATSTVGVGEWVNAGRRRSVDDFNRAATNRSLKPIGENLPGHVKTGRESVKYAGDRLGAAYDEILPQLRATGDKQFVDDLAAIHQEAQSLEPARAAQFDRILGGMGRFWQDGTDLSGDALKEIEERLGQRIRRYASSPDADQQELGAALEQVRSSVRDLVGRQNPEHASRLQSINQGWASLTQVEKAALTGKNGVFSPQSYSQAVRQSSDTVRRRCYSRGTALNQYLADAASEVLPSQVPDSGTATRLNQTNIIGLIQAGMTAPAYAAAKGLNRAYTRETGPASALAAQGLDLLQKPAVHLGIAASSLVANQR